MFAGRNWAGIKCKPAYFVRINVNFIKVHRMIQFVSFGELFVYVVDCEVLFFYNVPVRWKRGKPSVI